jgi:hypothetical protein
MERMKNDYCKISLFLHLGLAVKMFHFVFNNELQKIVSSFLAIFK